MAAYPESLESLVATLARLPGIGRKSAERLAFHVLGRPADVARSLADAVLRARERIRPCAECGGLAEGDCCPVCSDPKRERSPICVVERARDVFAMERSCSFRGRYHVLGGVISPLHGVGPEHLAVDPLLARLKRGDVGEVILALNPSIEGETTSMYLARLIRPLDVKVSRIAYGLPVGGELEYSDPVTLARALEGRRVL